MSQAHTSRAHAKLAPSAAHRWISCPGSVRATADLPDDTSEAAAEGTAAHELCAVCLSNELFPDNFLGQWVDIKEGKIVDTPVDTDEEHRFFLIDDEMVDGVDIYVEHVRWMSYEKDDAQLEVEQRLDMTHLHSAIFGTGDATVYLPTEKHLHVVDFKYGKGVVVEADNNPQLLLYAAGAARRYHNQQIERLTIHVVQPRASHPKGPIRSYEIDLIDLFEFEDTLAKAAAATDAEDAPFKAGHWCHDSFCKLQATCPVNRAYRFEQAGIEFGNVDIDPVIPKADSLTPDQRGRIMRAADGILSLVKAVQQAEHDKAMAGDVLPGWKLVAKRAVRKWKDEAAAKATMLELAIEPFEPAKLKSPAKAESGFPGKNKEQRAAAMAEYVTKQSSGFNLVPVEHPGAAVALGAASDFDHVEEAA